MEPGRTRGDSISSMIDSLSLNSSKSSSPLRTSPSVQASSSTLSPPVPLVTVPSTLVPSSSSENSSNSTFVLFQPSCSKHRYIRNHHDLSEIVERPERIKAVTAGIASVWSKHEKLVVKETKWTPPPPSETPSSAVVEDQDELGSLMKGLSIDRKREKKKVRGEIIGKSSPFDILFSNDQLSIDSQALKLIHGVPNYPPSTTTPTSSNTDPPPPPVLKEEEESSSPSRRRSSPRKPPPPPPSSTPYPTDSPWPSQLLHLIKQIPPEPPTPASNNRRTFNNKSNQTRKESEIPLHLPQGDLYLSSESDQAIFGALGAVCKGVDLICNTTTTRSSDGTQRSCYSGRNSSSCYKEGFVVVRPPGHHCGESSPQGFCFVNNVAIAAAHAHLEHGINRVAILDIDLHHGNGTQEIVWGLNEKANKTLMKQQQPSPRKSNSPSKLSSFEKDQDPPRPLQIMYSSLHDVLSYRDQQLITSASLQISGPHSQFIQNTHLEPYSSLLDFKERLWEKYWNSLGGEKLIDFFEKTQAKEEETLILVSCGFDCSIHEYSTMSRHGSNVPTLFFKQFSKRIKQVARKYSKGKVLFVLEGGYSDKALVSGSFSVLEGLILSNDSDEEDEEEENLEDLERILQVCGLASNNTIHGSGGGGSKKKYSTKGGIGSGGGVVKEDDKDWIKRTKEIFDYLQLQQQQHLDETETEEEDRVSTTDTRFLKPTTTTLLTNTDSGGGGGRQLRERKIKLDYAGLANHSLPLATQQQQQQQQSQQPQQSSTLSSTTPTPSRPASTSATTGTAFASIPPASFYPPPPTTTTTQEDLHGQEEKELGGDRDKEINVNPNPNPPKIKFVWKQGGIGGNNTAGSSSSTLGEPRM
ncbi:hypothetical protein JCM5350_000371 [Sporobolomyces pararoseus]